MNSVKDAARVLKISPRSVQEKCNKFKLPKVNGQFSISDEVLNLWLENKKRETNEAQTQPNSRSEAPKKLAENRALIKWVFGVSILLVVLLFIGLSYHYTDKIETIEKTDKVLLDKEKAERKADSIGNEAIKQDLKTELQEVKDELKTIKSDPRVKRFFKN
jgi:hypothetical protein